MSRPDGALRSSQIGRRRVLRRPEGPCRGGVSMCGVEVAVLRAKTTLWRGYWAYYGRKRFCAATLSSFHPATERGDPGFSHVRMGPRGAPPLWLGTWGWGPALQFFRRFEPFSDHFFYSTKKQTVECSFSKYFHPRDTTAWAVPLRGGATPLLCTKTQKDSLRALVINRVMQVDADFAHRIVFGPFRDPKTHSSGPVGVADVGVHSKK